MVGWFLLEMVTYLPRRDPTDLYKTNEENTRDLPWLTRQQQSQHALGSQFTYSPALHFQDRPRSLGHISKSYPWGQGTWALTVTQGHWPGDVKAPGRGGGGEKKSHPGHTSARGRGRQQAPWPRSSETSLKLCNFSLRLLFFLSSAISY